MRDRSLLRVPGSKLSLVLSVCLSVSLPLTVHSAWPATSRAAPSIRWHQAHSKRTDTDMS